jgi:positive regulator of sigma E activity
LKLNKVKIAFANLIAIFMLFVASLFYLMPLLTVMSEDQLAYLDKNTQNITMLVLIVLTYYFGNRSNETSDMMKEIREDTNKQSFQKENTNQTNENDYEFN